jgi:hypothetical protein
MSKSSSGGLPPSLPSDDKNKSSGCGSPNDRTSEYGSIGTPNIDLDEDEDDFDSINLQSNSASNNQFSNSMLNSSNSSYVKSPGNCYSELSLLREDGKPAGLKNVGNTCWFNSIIQAFFHLPFLRGLIMSFQINEADLCLLDENVRTLYCREFAIT